MGPFEGYCGPGAPLHTPSPSKIRDRNILGLYCEITLGNKRCSVSCFVVKIHSEARDVTLLVEFLVIMLEALAFIPRDTYTGHNDRSPVNAYP